MIRSSQRSLAGLSVLPIMKLCQRGIRLGNSDEIRKRPPTHRNGHSSGFSAVIQQEDFLELPITSTHMVRSTLLPGDHRDPFDRILAAQSLSRTWQ